MTPKERAAMQQALEALEVYEIKLNSRLCNEAITALREALAEQAEQEPVAWAISHSLGLEFGSKYPMQETKEAAEQMARQHMGAVVVTPLYAAPVRTKDLTDEEMEELCRKYARFELIREAIAADRSKNGIV